MILNSAKDINDVIAHCWEHDGAVFSETDLCADFFDLRTRLAGELFQKIVNYRTRLAIVLADVNAYGERFSELVYEHRKHGAVRFFATHEDARAWLDGKA